MLKRIALGALLVVVVAVFAVIVLGHKAEKMPVFRMANGTEVTLGAVTYGPSNTFAWGKPHQKSLYKVLPAKFKSWSGCQVMMQTTSDTNNPVFWVCFSQARPGNVGVRLLDEFGCEHDPGGYSMGSTMFGGQEQICYYQLDAYAPHGKIVGLCIYESETKTQRAGQFLISGRAVTSLPGAKQVAADPTTNGDMTFQLMSVVTGLMSEPGRYNGKTNDFPFTQAVLQMRRDGANMRGWMPRNVKVTSPAGKTIRPRLQHAAYIGDDIAFNFEGVLDPAVGQWKLEFEFVHERDFAPEEIVTFTNVGFPGYAEVTEINRTNKAQGRTVTLEKTYGAFSERTIKYFTAERPVLEAGIAPETKGLHLQLVHVTGNDGKELSNWGQASEGKGKYFFGLRSQTNSETMDLTFAVHTSRYVEFITDPVMVTVGK